MPHSETALSRAKALLGGGSRYHREANVTYDIGQLLSALEGVEDADIVREHSSGGGRIDILLPRFRTVIEVKKATRTVHAEQSLPATLESAQPQLERYIAAEIEAERSRLSSSGQPLSEKRWTGILADGRHWRCWTYDSGISDPAASRQPGFLLGPDSEPGILLDALTGALVPDPNLKTWIPSDPSELFKGRPEDLAELFQSLPASVRPGAMTKLALWHDMLRASGLSPQGSAGDASQFALHSFLIAVARMVTHLLSSAGSPWKSCLQDGFASWVLDWEAGRAWTESLWDTVRRYDWRSRRGDVLRALYESFVSEGDRHVFGEYYTPDWLAGMMVEQCLDGKWLDRAIPQAEVALQERKPLKGVGVLDPACGSGTFLYHAVLRILGADAMQDLSAVQQADAAALLVSGIDVHPVAVEVAKATVLRALPAEPSAGASAIRIHLGDSLLTDEDRTSLFGHREGAMRLETPQGREFFVPLEFVRQDGFADAMRRLVRAAVQRKPVPPVLLRSVGEAARRDLQACRDALEGTVQSEGNSVWTWYAVNRAAPHLLAERKVDRIVANPPWVKLSSIQEPGRKRAMEGLSATLGLQAGGKQAANLDIATFFVLRSRELYLERSDSNCGVWLVKRSALGAGHWGRFRNLHRKHLSQTVDLVDLQPFGGGDARRCCLLVEHTKFSASEPEQGQPKQVKSKLRTRKRPKPSEEWTDVRSRIQLVRVRPPPPQEHSGYAPETFRRGADVFPYVLLLAKSVFPQGRQRVRVKTERSMHKPWSTVPSQEVEVPNSWVFRLIRSNDLFAFAVDDAGSSAIIPADDTGSLTLDSAIDEPGWEILDDLWRKYRSKGKATPKTLAMQLDFRGKLSSQPRTDSSDRRMVLYPKAGDIMRAARVGFQKMRVIGHSLYWNTSNTEAEAGYLVSLLNASCLQRAFRKSRGSGRDFEQHPWRKVPIPRFDPNDRCHTNLVNLCSQAESEAAKIRDRFPGAGQIKVSNEIRNRLKECGIADRIDDLARRVLPGQGEP